MTEENLTPADLPLTNLPTAEHPTGELPPTDLPTDAHSYWHSHSFPQRPMPEPLPAALEKLGASPFPKSKFPFLGFIATVYDQIANSVHHKKKPE